uniref:Uncharacterized protein n=1 Tax=Ditylenchus dipsaci TaxID=166011 RepID=A0A915DEI5_9BILA
METDSRIAPRVAIPQVSSSLGVQTAFPRLFVAIASAFQYKSIARPTRRRPAAPPTTPSTTSTTGKRPRKQNAQFIRKRSWRKSSCSSTSSVSSGGNSPTRPLLSFGLGGPAADLFERKSEERHCSSNTSSSSPQSKQQVARPSSAGANNSVYPVSGRLSHYIHSVSSAPSHSRLRVVSSNTVIFTAAPNPLDAIFVSWFKLLAFDGFFIEFVFQKNTFVQRALHMPTCSQPFRNQSSLAKHRSLCPNNTKTTPSSTNPEVQMASTLYNPHLLHYSNLSSTGASLSSVQPGGAQLPTTPNNLMLHLNSSKAPRPSLIHPFQTPSLPPTGLTCLT